MDEKTARHYRDDERLPSARKSERTYRTRIDPFEHVWPEVQRRLEAEPRLQANLDLRAVVREVRIAVDKTLLLFRGAQVLPRF